MFKGYKHLLFITLGLIATVAISNWYAQMQIQQAARSDVSSLLHSVLNTSHQALVTWSRQERASASIWANNNRVREYTEELLQMPRSRSLLAASRSQKALQELLEPVLRSRGYQGYFIISPDGTSLASSRQQNIGLPNLLKEQPWILQKLFEGQTAISYPQASDVPMRDTVTGRLVTGLPTMFVGAPVYDLHGQVIAAFVFRIDPYQDFTSILQRGRIAETGETYAFNQHGRMVSDSRFNGQLHELGLLQPGQHAMLNIELRDPGANLDAGEAVTGEPQSWPLTRMAQSGIRGESGYDLDGYNDYRGNMVVGAWLWDDSLNIGLVTEVDKQEAYATVSFVSPIVYILSALAILLLLILAIYVVNSQRKLEENRQRVAGIVEMSDEAILSIDGGHHIILANPAAETIFGYTHDELLQMRLEELIPDAYRDAHRKHVDRFRDSSEVMISRDVRGNISGLRKNGEVFTLEATISKQHIAGQVVMTVSARDVTEREQAIKSLRNNERMFREMFEASEDAIFLLDGDTFVDCNPATLRIFGAPDKAALLALHPWDISPEFQPDGQPSQAKAKAMIQQAMNNYFNRFEWRHKRLSGETFPAEITLTTTQYDGKPMVYGAVRDITEAKRAEEALRDSETQLRKIIDQSPVAMVITDTEGNIELFNTKFIATYGWTTDDMRTPEQWWQLAYPDPDYRLRVQQTWDRAIQEAMAQNKEIAPQFWNLTCKDGSVREVEFRMVPISTKRHIIAMNDITERKAAEAALQDSEARLRMLADHANDMISIHDADGVYRYASPACERLLGYREEELLGHSAYEYFHPDDLEIITASHNTIIEEHVPSVLRYRIRRKDGDYIWFETTSNTVVDPDSGEVREIVAVSRDVNARIRAEDELRRARDKAQSYLDTVEAIMVALDSKGHITMVNRKAREVLGYEEAELLGKDWFAFCLPQPEGMEQVKPVFYDIVSGKIEAAEYFENALRTRDGETPVIAWHNTLLRDDEGNITGTLSAGQDITDLRDAEEKEEQLHRQLIHSQKMEALGRLTGGIAHDFNNILASAKGYTEMAMMRAEDANDEKQLHYLDEVLKSTERAAAVVKQMLAYARGGKTEPTPQLLQDVIGEAMVMMRPLLTASIEITTQLDPEVYPVLIDSVQMNQVLLNLCINARDAMEGEGAIKIGVRMSRMEGECSSCHEAIDGDCVELYVTDSGPGIDDSTLEHIFDPFFTSKEVGKGSGMGLSVVHGIVHDHGGHIQVLSELGQGTTFRIFLPLA